MKTLLEYIEANQKDYKIRIKLAFEPSKDQMATLERHLKKYDVKDVSDVARLMLQSQPTDFPDYKGFEIYLIDAVTALPVSYETIKQELCELLSVDASLVRVRNPDVPREDEVDQQEESEEEYIARLTDEKYSEVEKTKTKPAFGDDFNASFLKDLAGQKRKQEFAKKSDVKPSKPLKQEKSLSPISGRNTIPDPMKIGR
jgi:hypothetical protein